MKKIIIFGLTDLSMRVSHHIQQDGQYEIAAYTVEQEYMQEEFLDKPVVPFEKVEECYPPDLFGMLICVGYTNMNMVRKRIYSEAKEKGYHIVNYIHPTATIATDMFVGGGQLYSNE